MRVASLILLSLALFAGGCDDTRRIGTDAGTDAAVDGGELDGSLDADVDAGFDAGYDAGYDAGFLTENVTDITARMPMADDAFGYAVAIDGDTIAIAARDQDSAGTGVDADEADTSARDSGAVYVFGRDGAQWRLEAFIKPSNTSANDHFGQSIALEGDTLVVGAPDKDGSATGVNGTEDDGVNESGATYVFVRADGVWTQQAYIKGAANDSLDRFGRSVALSGDSIVIGCGDDSASRGVGGDPANNDAGAAGSAYVFVRSGETWTQEAYLKASNAETADTFGYAVDIDGDTIVVGATQEDSGGTGVGSNQENNTKPDSGAAYVFVRTGTTWAQQAYLKANNSSDYFQFGYTVAVSGDVVAVGSPAATRSAATYAGTVYVFRRTDTTWAVEANLNDSGYAASDRFGAALAADGDYLVIGAPQVDVTDGATNSGAAFAFEWLGDRWEQSDIEPSRTGDNFAFGASIAISGTDVLIGAPGEDIEDVEDTEAAGAAHFTQL